MDSVHVQRLPPIFGNKEMLLFNLLKICIFGISTPISVSTLPVISTAGRNLPVAGQGDWLVSKKTKPPVQPVIQA